MYVGNGPGRGETRCQAPVRELSAAAWTGYRGSAQWATVRPWGRRR